MKNAIYLKELKHSSAVLNKSPTLGLLRNCIKLARHNKYNKAPPSERGLNYKQTNADAHSTRPDFFYRRRKNRSENWIMCVNFLSDKKSNL